jgi:hypothetical protein
LRVELPRKRAAFGADVSGFDPKRQWQPRAFVAAKLQNDRPNFLWMKFTAVQRLAF